MQSHFNSLRRLAPYALDAHARALNQERAAREWELAACLLAVERTQTYLEFQATSAANYAERQLGLSHFKATELLRVARLLVRYEKLSEAFRDGRLNWSKLQEISRVVTPTTENSWLDFALGHSTREVERAVAVTPTAWRRMQTAQADAEGVSTDAVGGTPPGPDASHKAGGAHARAPISCSATPALGVLALPREPSSESAAPSGVITPKVGVPEALPEKIHARETREGPSPPHLVRVALVLNSDQYKIFETALSRIRSKKGRRLSREKALTEILESYLASGPAGTRTRHPVVVHEVVGAEVEYYETERGCLPVGPGVRAHGAPLRSVETARAKDRPAPADGERAAEALAQPAAEALAEPAAEAQAAREVAEPAAAAQATKTQTKRAVAARGAGEVAPVAGSSRSTNGTGDADPPEAAVKQTEQPAPGDTSTRKPPSRYLPVAVRRAALERAGWRCEWCGCTETLQFDHVVPVCDGGGNGTAEEGIRVLCRDCHRARHEDDLAGDPRYAGWLAGRTKRRSAEDSS